MTGGRLAVVTGAAGGLGRAIVARLVADGLRVAACDIRADGVETLATELGDRVAPFALDVTDEAAVRATVAAITAQLGAPAVLINNAGVIEASRFHELTLRSWQRVIDVNLTGAFLMTREVVPAMRNAGWGRIVNVASDAAKTAEPWITAYSASKFALIGLTQSVALEYATEGITVNAVCPAIMDTEMMTGLAATLERAGMPVPEGGWESALAAEIPQGHPMRPDEVAHACAFFLADAARSITGEALNVSGGHEMH